MVAVNSAYASNASRSLALNCLIAIGIATNIYCQFIMVSPHSHHLDCILSGIQASGVKVADDCLKAFQALKLKKTHKYIIFSLNADSTEIIVEKTSSESDYAKFLEDLPASLCKWAVYDFEFEKDGKRNKICFISWSVALLLPLTLLMPCRGISSGLRMRPKSDPRWCLPLHETLSGESWMESRLRFRVLTPAKSATRPVRRPHPMCCCMLT